VEASQHQQISCTSAYNPQADPAEQANQQVLETLRAAVSSVTDFDQWDQALPHLCFGTTRIPLRPHTYLSLSLRMDSRTAFRLHWTWLLMRS